MRENEQLLDEFLPTYDVSDAVALVVRADVGTTWDALMNVDLMDVGRRRPLVGILGVARMLPDIVNQALHGRPAAARPVRMRLRDMPDIPLDKGGWVLLGLRERDEVALGLVGRFWRPVIEFAQVPAAAFRDYSVPGFAKTIYSLSVRSLGDGRTLVSGVMRTATTDEHARKWFRRYWTMGVGSGAHVLVQALLETVRDVAERGSSERLAS